MNLDTLTSLIRSGQLLDLLSLGRTVRRYHRVAFVGAGLANGLLRRLAGPPVPLERLMAKLEINPSMRDALEAWLELGVGLGELRSGPDGYVVRGRLSRRLTRPENDTTAACCEEVAMLHTALITQSLDRLRKGKAFTLADQDARMIARSSRVAEPFIGEAMDAVIPRHGKVRLLEIGCGSAAYIRHAALRNPELTALGLELQPDAASLAAENLARWGLTARVAVEVGDIRKRPADPSFDVVTLHQNIYYFPVAERTSLLRHVRSFLAESGRIVLTTFCRGRGSAAGVLSLWGAMTEGCGRLPAREEMVEHLRGAGFGDVTARSLVPGESFYAFTGKSEAGGERR